MFLKKQKKTEQKKCENCEHITTQLNDFSANHHRLVTNYEKTIRELKNRFSDVVDKRWETVVKYDSLIDKYMEVKDVPNKTTKKENS